MIYLKRVINQDLERTPTFSVEAVRNFFDIILNNGEFQNRNIRLLPNNLVFDVKFQKRGTRDEYRIFLKDLFKRINPNEGDILIFKKINDMEFSCEHVSIQSSQYLSYNNFFKIGSNHQLVLDDLVFDEIALVEAFSKSGLVFSKSILKRFIASLCTKQFLILTGLSGSGKTKLAQAFAKWISESNDQYLLVPVGADWTNREPLLGYPNSLEPQKYVTPESGVIQIITKSIENPDKPYFLILDEMNLSHVERYFADFLSAMESKESVKLYSDSDRYTKFDNDNKPVSESRVLDKFKLPSNLFIIGTVNIDETTYMFSPKVLDRANTIEFRLTEDDLDLFFQNSSSVNLSNLHEGSNESKPGLGFNQSKIFMDLVNKSNDKIDYSRIGDVLKMFFINLKNAGAEFGYRSINEIARLIGNLEYFGSSLDEAIDIAVMQKLLPKLHGSRSKMIRVLPILADSCLIDLSSKTFLDEFVKGNDVFKVYKGKIKYLVSLEKISRMYKNALDNGFTSYAEA
jgi:energy-coupling factor transporter ATP-binding protein EcfA2